MDKIDLVMCVAVLMSALLLGYLLYNSEAVYEKDMKECVSDGKREYECKAIIRGCASSWRSYATTKEKLGGAL